MEFVGTKNVTASVEQQREMLIAIAKRLGATFRGRTTRYYGQEL